MAEGSRRPSLGQIAAAGRRRLREAVDDCIDRPYLPQPPDDTDLFLVAYPKSGINWLKWLMATTNLLLSGDKREITFFNHSDFIADLHSVSRVGPPTPAGPRLPLLHQPCALDPALPQGDLSRARSAPRDALLPRPSPGRAVWQGSLEEMVEHRLYGIRAWADHVGGWLDKVDATASFTLLRYEDLLARTTQELTRLYDLLGWRLESAVAAEVLARVTIERMRAHEAKFNEGHPRRRDTEFVRKGDIKGPRQPVPEAVLRRIEAEAGPLMRRLGYLDD